MTKIIWNGTSLRQTRNEGYKNAEDEIVPRLVEQGLDISRECLVPTDVQFINNSGIGLAYESNASERISSEILINNRLPHDYQVGSGYSIGFSYWETNKLPGQWVTRMNQMDEIWTTSLWAKNVFIDSGVTVPVYNFSLGIHKEFFYPILRTRKSPFTFLSIGSPSTRKNSQVAVDAFIKMFGGKDGYRLLYKSVDCPDARLKDAGGGVLPISSHGQIDIIDADVDLETLSKIYDSVDCLIYPTSGEGWGILPYQAIAKGIPTICTNATSCTEYAEMSVPLDYKWSNYNMSGIYDDTGTWAEPDFDDLCDKMLYVVNNYDEIAKKTYDNATAQFETMTWDWAAKGYYNRLCQILNQ